MPCYTPCISNFKKNKSNGKCLKEIISTIEKLKDDEQRQIAKLLGDEINWDITLQNSQDESANLANEALSEYQKGKTQQTDW